MKKIDKSEILNIGKNAKEASRVVSLLNPKLKNEILKAASENLQHNSSIIIDENSLFIKDQMVLDTNSAKMLWRGRINKNDSQYLEELDLYLKMRLRVGENIPWYAGIFGGLPVAASAYIFREVFESDIDDATTFEFDVVGSINNPQINRIN